MNAELKAEIDTLRHILAIRRQLIAATRVYGQFEWNGDDDGRGAQCANIQGEESISGYVTMRTRP